MFEQPNEAETSLSAETPQHLETSHRGKAAFTDSGETDSFIRCTGTLIILHTYYYSLLFFFQTLCSKPIKCNPTLVAT